MSLKQYKVWANVGPIPFTSNGTSNGVVTVSSVLGFYQGQNVVITATGLPTKNLQVKRIISLTQLVVGPQDGSERWSSINLYTVALNAQIQAPEQDYGVDRYNPDVQSATYEHAPIAAQRSILVDPFGQFYTETNPIPIIFDGTINVGEVEVRGTNGNFIEPNPDGSINVVVEPGPPPNQQIKIIYNEVLSLAANSSATIVTYTVPPSKRAILQRISGAGENIARYDVTYNSSLINTKRSFYGNLNVDFDYFSTPETGFMLNSGDTVLITVFNGRPAVANFEGSIQVLEIS